MSDELDQSRNVTIKLGEYLSGRKACELRVDIAKEQLERAIENLSSFKTRARKDFAKLVAEGKTTGDGLQDEIISIIGPEEKMIEKILGFSKHLQSQAGKKCLMAFSWQRQIRFRLMGGNGDDDFRDETGYVLGILSGERLRIVRNGDFFSIVMPFTKHASMNLRFLCEPKKRPGPYIVGHPKRPDATSEVSDIFQAIIGPNNGPAKTMVGFSIRLQVPPALEKLLDEPDEAEKATASGI